MSTNLMLWYSNQKTPFWSTLAILDQGHKEIVIGCDTNNAYWAFNLFSARNAVPLWNSSASSFGDLMDNILVHPDGNIIGLHRVAGSHYSSIISIDPANVSATVEAFRVDVPLSSIAIGADGIIYASSTVFNSTSNLEDVRLVAVDPSTGNVLWNHLMTDNNPHARYGVFYISSVTDDTVVLTDSANYGSYFFNLTSRRDLYAGVKVWATFPNGDFMVTEQDADSILLARYGSDVWIPREVSRISSMSIDSRGIV